MQDNKNWEEKIDLENWHAIEGPGGVCACGIDNGICHGRLKSFISTLLSEFADEVKKNMAKEEKECAAGHTDRPEYYCEYCVTKFAVNEAVRHDHKALEAAKLKFGIK